MAGQNRIADAFVIAVAVLPSIVETAGAPFTLRHAGNGLGWLGAGLLSGSLLLMVREPPIVRWFGGLERMHRWHHALGVWACAVLLAHPIVLAAAVLPDVTRAVNLLSPSRWFPANALGWAALLGLTVGLSKDASTLLPVYCGGHGLSMAAIVCHSAASVRVSHAARMARARRRICFSVSTTANSATPTPKISSPSSSGTDSVANIRCSGGR